MIIKFRDERKGEHIHSRVFVGPDEDHLALAGTLIMRLGEWQTLGAALLLGAKSIKKSVVGPAALTVLFPDDEEIVTSYVTNREHTIGDE